MLEVTGDKNSWKPMDQRVQPFSVRRCLVLISGIDAKGKYHLTRSNLPVGILSLMKPLSYCCVSTSVRPEREGLPDDRCSGSTLQEVTSIDSCGSFWSRTNRARRNSSRRGYVKPDTPLTTKARSRAWSG